MWRRCGGDTARVARLGAEERARHAPRVHHQPLVLAARVEERGPLRFLHVGRRLEQRSRLRGEARYLGQLLRGGLGLGLG